MNALLQIGLVLFWVFLVADTVLFYKMCRRMVYAGRYSEWRANGFKRFLPGSGVWLTMKYRKSCP
jgi:hypothetical protein